MLAREPFVLVSGFADVDAVLQEVGEGTVGEGYPAVVFPDLGIPALGDDAPAVEILHQLPKTLQFEVTLEDIAHGLGLGLIDNQLLVLSVITQRHGTPSPFALAP